MFADYSKDLLRSGIIEVKAGNPEAARRYLDRAVYMSSDHDVMAEAWYWLSQITDNAVDKRTALENCLANDLEHARARRVLAIFDGKLNPNEIIDPETLPPAPLGLRKVDAGRFMCPRCGGRMTYTPDGGSLVCEYCRRHESPKRDGVTGQVNDFIVAMATRRGHGKPLREQVAHCQGCGAEFILGPEQLTFECAYCGSAHVVKVERSEDLVAPDRILPHAFDQGHAAGVLRGWVEDAKIEPDKPVRNPRGLYLPAWTFSLGGGIDYTAEMPAEAFGPARAADSKGTQVQDRVKVEMNVSIAASSKPAAPFVRLIPTFDMEGIQPYDPRYLAAWPAELYDVAMADASLEARSQAYAGLKREVPSQIRPARLLSTSSANLAIEDFHLDLLPVWTAEIANEGGRRLVLINGQNGTVQGQGFGRSNKANGGLLEWLADLVEE